jgi:glucokinase
MTATRVPHRRARVVERFVLGIDVGGTTIKAGVVHLPSGRLLNRSIAPTKRAHGGKHILDQVGEIGRATVKNGLPRGRRIAAIGIAVPELVDLRGRLASSETVRWTPNDVRRALSGSSRQVLCSDVQAAALAEAHFGAGRGESAFLYVSVGTGVSCSLVIEGRPFTGAHGFALAFASGSTSRTAGDPPQSLESRVGGPALLRRARAVDLEVADGSDVLSLADAGPGAARTIVDDAASELALHTAILVNALDPSAIVLGGGLGSAKGRYWKTFCASLPSFLYRPSGNRLRIRQAKLGPYAGIAGAGYFAELATSDV